MERDGTLAVQYLRKHACTAETQVEAQYDFLLYFHLCSLSNLCTYKVERPSFLHQFLLLGSAVLGPVSLIYALIYKSRVESSGWLRWT
jgi:hypothetical protein